MLDTNRLTDVLAGVPEAVTRVETALEVSVPPIVLGELRAGFVRGKRPERNEQALQWFLSQPGVSVPPVTEATSHRYAAVWAALRKRGTPIPTNDLWIAASALEHGLAVFTRDAHFSRVPGLAVV